jgi:ribA/ribD-fused uncharacterized protein
MMQEAFTRIPAPAVDAVVETSTEDVCLDPVLSAPDESVVPARPRFKRGEGYFWVGHHTRGYLANEYQSTFDVDGMKFLSVSWYMWYRRAQVWSPRTDLAVLIREAVDLDKAKQLSRRCTSAGPALCKAWFAVRLKVMAKAVLRKFQCSEQLARQLLETGTQTLVFASQYDAFYGIGMTMKEGQKRRDEWGKNYLGEMLMLVRQRLVEGCDG